MKDDDSEDLFACEVCRGAISRNAVTCPHCGDPIGHDRGLAGCAGALFKLWIIAIIAWGLLSSCFSWLWR